jgi:hypothetical protein
MATPHGVNTEAIAEQLKHKLDADRERFYGIEVFYDHGDSSKPEVCEPTTYMGRRYGADATLSAVDIVVVEGKNVLLAIEIEESTVRPKTIIGDVFGIALADRIRIQRRPYSIKNATIIVAIADDGKGKQSAKYVRLERHLDRYFKANPSKSVKKVRIIPCPTHDLVRRIERLIRLETGKRSQTE